MWRAGRAAVSANRPFDQLVTVARSGLKAPAGGLTF
jgi:hypothetical protein